jgi:hypothetical protein
MARVSAFAPGSLPANRTCISDDMALSVMERRRDARHRARARTPDEGCWESGFAMTTGAKHPHVPPLLEQKVNSESSAGFDSRASKAD